ncbi:angiotensin-converting enzyme-like [Lycorma delicatula]|uniref:angiotensin-converting enzyme-like n=1 Tax=Lycorma delicatula TaxID=130591 RepID=UPI003F518E01
MTGVISDQDKDIEEKVNRLSEERTVWRNSRCADLSKRSKFNHDQVVHRMIYLLCRGPKYTPHQARQLTAILAKLQNIYTETRVCRGVGFPCYSGEPGLERTVRKSKDAAVLLWAWESWRDSVRIAKPLYMSLISLQNRGAKNNGYKEIGECWREELETPNLKHVVEQLYHDVLPFFTLLHAFVRHKLSSVYGKDLVPLHKPIPAHLLGNLWSQNWDSLIDILLPYEDSKYNLDNKIKALNWTVKSMAKRAEQFYISLGLPPMTKKFWSHSKFDNSGACHGTAANMFAKEDYRIVMCAENSMEDYYVMHHEMGHVQYYMAYSDQPAVFQDGANSGFQEAVGDAIMLAVMSPNHLRRLNLIDDLSSEFEIYLLLLQALNKIPQLGFGLALEKWRWDTMSRDVSSSNYNSHWWILRRQYQGIRPPTFRSEQHFDPAAKFHIADNTPYIRYFLSGFLQMQIFESMCNASGQTELRSLHRCDIYNSKAAGNKLRNMMSTGSSKQWTYVMYDLTSGNETSYSSKSLLNYFKPLIIWLEEQIKKHQIPVNW